MTKIERVEKRLRGLIERAMKRGVLIHPMAFGFGLNDEAGEAFFHEDWGVGFVGDRTCLLGLPVVEALHRGRRVPLVTNREVEHSKRFRLQGAKALRIGFEEADQLENGFFDLRAGDWSPWNDLGLKLRPEYYETTVGPRDVPHMNRTWTPSDSDPLARPPAYAY
jgi:hypothetical protein